jgi:hypothetical protein
MEGVVATVKHVQRGSHVPVEQEMTAAAEYMRDCVMGVSCEEAARRLCREASLRKPSKRLRALANFKKPVVDVEVASMKTEVLVGGWGARLTLALERDLQRAGVADIQLLLGEDAVQPSQRPAKVREVLTDLCAEYERFVELVVAPELRKAVGAREDAGVLYQVRARAKRAKRGLSLLDKAATMRSYSGRCTASLPPPHPSPPSSPFLVLASLDQFPCTVRCQTWCGRGEGGVVGNRRMKLGPMHCDRDYGHQAGEINYWLPLAPVPNSVDATLWVESGVGAGEFAPVLLGEGEYLRFHGQSLRHFAATAEGGQGGGQGGGGGGTARISLDWRVALEENFDKQWKAPGCIFHHEMRRVGGGGR